MRSALRLFPSEFLETIGREGARRRALSIALVIAIHVALLLMLLTLAIPPERIPKSFGLPTVIEFLPEAKEAPERARPAAKAKAATREEAPKTPPPVPIPPPPIPPPVPSVWTKIIPLTKEEIAQSDVALLGARRRPGEAGERNGPASDTGSGEAAGGGPNGEKLYEADWQRRPTDAELATYMPRTGVRVGWGAVACRTVANYRVEDCQEIGQFPPGSGLSRAVREAAWQFRVRPPRIGGKSMVGAWVRIRIDYTERTAED